MSRLDGQPKGLRRLWHLVKLPSSVLCWFAFKGVGTLAMRRAMAITRYGAGWPLSLMLLGERKKLSQLLRFVSNTYLFGK
ncbi:hypothetical protein [Hymenobacter sp. PAMC 26628]|uniref:hypothetical protein n=1 Tax=Hymenobacter sp. PAMC 26628 TaxID=1484118 RepID=UPI0012FF7617|nr:hypothetical protein [Hymenobacter sp. PAMC 26628]